jgi:hypothetical protein
MSALIDLSIDVTSLPKEKFTTAKNGKVYYNCTIAVNTETNQWGKNVSMFDSQTPEEREAKKPKAYLGNGKVFWTDGAIAVAERQDDVQGAVQQEAPIAEADEVDLPF